MAGVRAIFSF